MIYFFLYSWGNPENNAFLVEEKRGGFIKQGHVKLRMGTKKELWDYAEKHFANENYVYYKLENQGFLGDN